MSRTPKRKLKLRAAAVSAAAGLMLGIFSAAPASAQAASASGGFFSNIVSGVENFVSRVPEMLRLAPPPRTRLEGSATVLAENVAAYSTHSAFITGNQENELRFFSESQKATTRTPKQRETSSSGAAGSAAQSANVGADRLVQSIQRLDCGGCHFEFVSGTNPLNQDYGYVFSTGGFAAQTNNGWTAGVLGGEIAIDGLPDPLLQNHMGDVYFAFDQRGRVVLVSNSMKIDTSTTPWTFEYPWIGSLWTQNQPFWKSGNGYHAYRQSLIGQDLQGIAPMPKIVFDYPKVAVDTWPDSPFYKTVYVFAAAQYPDNLVTTLFVFPRGTDGPSTQIRNQTIEQVQVESAVVGPGGVLYASVYGGPSGGEEVYSSVDGGKTFTEHDVAPNNYLKFCYPRTFLGSEVPAFSPAAAPLALDSTGRIYVAWADNKSCVPDPNFPSDYHMYGDDYNVYVSYSDDQGRHWSAPHQVNDNGGSIYSAFPSLAVDQSDNGVYVAFIDHRNNPDKAQFDVYLAKSSDRGKTFSQNIKVNDESVPYANTAGGGREPGDYLSMLSIGKKNVFVAHPCVATSPWLLKNSDLSEPTDLCIATVSKAINTPQLPAPAARSELPPIPRATSTPRGLFSGVVNFISGLFHISTTSTPPSTLPAPTPSGAGYPEMRSQGSAADAAAGAAEISPTSTAATATPAPTSNGMPLAPSGGTHRIQSNSAWTPSNAWATSNTWTQSNNASTGSTWTPSNTWTTSNGWTPSNGAWTQSDNSTWTQSNNNSGGSTWTQSNNANSAWTTSNVWTQSNNASTGSTWTPSNTNSGSTNTWTSSNISTSAPITNSTTTPTSTPPKPNSPSWTPSNSWVPSNNTQGSLVPNAGAANLAQFFGGIAKGIFGGR